MWLSSNLDIPRNLLGTVLSMRRKSLSTRAITIWNALNKKQKPREMSKDWVALFLIGMAGVCTRLCECRKTLHPDWPSLRRDKGRRPLLAYLTCLNSCIPVSLSVISLALLSMYNPPESAFIRVTRDCLPVKVGTYSRYCRSFYRMISRKCCCDALGTACAHPEMTSDGCVGCELRSIASVCVIDVTSPRRRKSRCAIFCAIA